MKALGRRARALRAAPRLGLKPETIAAVREGMRPSSTRRARAGARGSPEIEIAGKTGSAQVVAHARLAQGTRRPRLMPHGWFICFAPADQPRIALAVLVEHGGSGGEAAAPVAHEILARFFGTSAAWPTCRRRAARRHASR